MLDGLREDEKHDADNDGGAKRCQIASNSHLFVDAFAELCNLSFQLITFHLSPSPLNNYFQCTKISHID